MALNALTTQPLTIVGDPVPAGTLVTVFTETVHGNPEWWRVGVPGYGMRTIPAAMLLPLPDELGVADLFMGEPYDHERDGL